MTEAGCVSHNLPIGPVHNFDTLPAGLVTHILNRMNLSTVPEHHFYATAKPTPGQKKTWTHLDVKTSPMFPGGVQSKIDETPTRA